MIYADIILKELGLTASDEFKTALQIYIESADDPDDTLLFLIDWVMAVERSSQFKALELYINSWKE